MWDSWRSNPENLIPRSNSEEALEHATMDLFERMLKDGVKVSVRVDEDEETVETVRVIGKI